MLRDVRISKNLSQGKLAEMAGVAQSTIHYLESENKNPSLEIARKLSKVLDMSVDVLFPEIEKQEEG